MSGALRALVAASLLWGLLGPSAAAAGERWAVVIGIDRYADARLEPLQFAARDAEAVTARLQQVGFAPERIVLLTDEDATRETILNLLGDVLPQRMAAGDSLLLYWSGHGITESADDGSQRGYLMTADARVDSPFATAIPMAALRQIAEKSPARHMLFLLDACYSGLAVPGLRAHLTWSPGGGQALLEKYASLPSRHVLTAGQAGERVLEVDGHGLFTYHLLRALGGDADTDRDGVLAATELAAWIRARVTEASSMAQTPQYARWFGEGEYTFVVGPVSSGSTAAVVGGRSRGMEEDPGAPRVTAAAGEPSSSQSLLRRARGPALVGVGLGMAIAGGALYVAGARSCAELGPDGCNAELGPVMGATIGLWGGGAAALGVGLAFSFGGPGDRVGLRHTVVWPMGDGALSEGPWEPDPWWIGALPAASP